jgi:hypothetical protein
LREDPRPFDASGQAEPTPAARFRVGEEGSQVASQALNGDASVTLLGELLDQNLIDLGEGNVMK